jgi:RND family efflux transporter MFP subunit
MDQRGAKSSLAARPAPKVWWFAAAFLLLAVALIAMLRPISGAPRDGEAKALEAEVFEAKLQNGYLERRLFTGTLTASEVSDLGFQVPGEIEKVLVSTGDRVEQGAVLAKLDPEKLGLRRQEALAQLAEAEAALRRAQSTAQRVLDLRGQGFATDQERDDAIAAREGSLERVRLLRRAAERAEADAGDTELIAPFAGFVVRRYADQGAVVDAGSPVLRLSENASLEAEVAVPDHLSRQLLPGAELSLLHRGKPFTVEVTGITQDIDPATRSRVVRMELPPGSDLTPGALVRVAISDPREGRGAWVPLSALQESYRGLWSVYVVDRSEESPKVMRKDVTILSLGDDQAFVTGTLEDGDLVIRAATFRFVPGQRITPVLGANPVSLAQAEGPSL